MKRETIFLFQLKQRSNTILSFNFRQQKLNQYELDFKIPSSPSFCHIKNALYLAGGRKSLYANQYYNGFRRISGSGKVVELHSLPTKKSSFPMTYWEKRNLLITLGGYAGGGNQLGEVHQFLILQNKWSTLPSLLEKTYSSSATVLNGVVYNIGGFKSTKSVCWLNLLNKKIKWK